MKRKGVIILLVLVVVLVGVVLYFIFRGGEPEQKPEIAGITGAEAGWRVITHPVFNLTFQIPEAWKIRVFEEGKGQAKVTFEAEGIAAEFNIYERPNLFDITADQLVQSEPNKFQKIERDGRVGVSYVSKAGREAPNSAEGEGGLIEDSYILTNQFFIGDNILETDCQIIGQAYKTILPTCERMVSEVHFSQ